MDKLLVHRDDRHLKLGCSGNQRSAMDSGLFVSTCQWLSDLLPLEVPGHIGKLAFNATKNSQALSPVCFTPTGRPRVPAPPQKDTASAEGTQRQSRDQLAPAEAYGGPALPHHRELRVPSGHMHVALGVRRVVARDHAAVVCGRVLSDRNRSCPSVLPRRVPDFSGPK